MVGAKEVECGQCGERIRVEDPKELLREYDRHVYRNHLPPTMAWPEAYERIQAAKEKKQW